VIYPFVQARFDIYGERTAPALAFVVHMAGGGGTVGYLARNPMRKVSVHFVVEYSGRIVQMLHLDRISGSINPADLRNTNDPPYTGYNGEVIHMGAAARRAVLGEWSWNPNQAVITCEVEGFAAVGPNKLQREALLRLSRDLADKLPTIRGLLGHRDFTSRKACPGKHINWASMAPTHKHGGPA
jgi:N-acetyl-anhydromuramyl-L-alanine amidase AmpD